MPVHHHLGIDASLDRIGWGLASDDRGEVEPIECGCEPIRPDGDITPGGLDYTRPALVRAVVERITGHVDRHLGGDDTLSVWIEAPWIGPSPEMARDLCVAAGSVWQALDCDLRADVQMLAPSEWKRLAAVPRTPKVAGARKDLKGVALRHYAAELAHEHFEPALADELLAVKPEKPLVYLRARMLRFQPAGSQDAADGGLIAYAGAVQNAAYLCDAAPAAR